MVEYLLILVLTVAMIMALSKGVGKPIQNYIQNNILGMVGCMLRVGQYPHIAYGICGEAAKLKTDMKGNFSGGSGGGGSGGSSDASANKSGEGDDDSSKDDSKSASNDSGSDSSSGNRNRFKSSGSTGSLGESDSDAFDDSSTKVVKINTVDLGSENNGELGVKGFQGDTGETVIVRRIRRDGQIGGSFFMSGDEEDQVEAEQANTPSKQTKKLPSSLITRRVAESSFSIPKSKKRGPQNTEIETEMEFSFFGIIKWGIIIAVLAVFGFFTMSQLNSIRKGWTN